MPDEFTAGTPSNTIENRRCLSRMHRVSNILFICYDYICSKERKKLEVVSVKQ